MKKGGILKLQANEDNQTAEEDLHKAATAGTPLLTKDE